MAVGLRKLTEKPPTLEGGKAAGHVGGVSSANGTSAIEPDAEVPVVYPVEDGGSANGNGRQEAEWTEVKTPPTLEDVDIFAAGPEVEQSNSVSAPSRETSTPAEGSRSVDAFMASLEALRATLRGGPLLKSAEGAAPADAEASLEHVENGHSHVAAGPDTNDRQEASGLDRIPLPPVEEGPRPTPWPLIEENPRAAKLNGREKKTPVRETPTLESALRAVRDAVPGLNVPEPKRDTPLQGRERPSSDGIPKSVSEDLPKYPARARMRTCARCGHETKLRDAKCQKCAHVDESLGILDSLIAGDLARVEQVLLVRPHLITMRTSRHDWTLLHMAASGGNPKMVELLIEKGVSVNAVNRDGKTALHYAAAKGHAGIVLALLKNSADPTVLYNGKSALDLARKNGRKEAEELLRRHLGGE